MRYICTLCADGFDAPGQCSTHKDEDLLDTDDEEVIRYLSDLDYRARMKNLSRWTIGLALLGAGIALAAQTGFLIIFAIAFAGGIVGLGAHRAQFRPRYLHWTRALDE